jgi:hypothetical protein
VYVSVNVCLCVSMDEMGCFEFWSFYVDIDVMRVYVGADGHVSSCSGSLLLLLLLLLFYYFYYYYYYYYVFRKKLSPKHIL